MYRQIFLILWVHMIVNNKDLFNLIWFDVFVRMSAVFEMTLRVTVSTRTRSRAWLVQNQHARVSVVVFSSATSFVTCDVSVLTLM